MLKGEEDLWFELVYGQPQPREKPPEGFDLTFDEYLFYLWERETEGRLKITKNSRPVMGKMKQMADFVGTGLIDMGFIPKGDISADLFPLSALPLMPGWGVADNYQHTAQLWQWCWQHPWVIEEMAKKNIRPGYAPAGQASYLMISNRVGPVTSVADLEGLSARGFGYSSIWVKTLGMTAVMMSASDAYEAMQKGILDVSGQSLPGIINKRFYEVADRVINYSIRVGGGGGVPADINLDTWNSFPKYMQDIIHSTLPEAVEYAENMNEVSMRLARELAVANGMSFIELSEGDKELYRMAIAPAWEKWVEDTEVVKGGERVREFLTEAIAFRDQLTGEPWKIYKP
jgi:TRAP-type C4-dicarboxylate transport system substrate-binding protein